MIKNIGIDIIENKRIKFNQNFISKVLSENEKKIFNSFTYTKRKREFLSGRWACKEAIIKILDKPITFNKIDIFYVNKKPTVKIKDLNIKISISHEKKYSVAVAILE